MAKKRRPSDQMKIDQMKFADIGDAMVSETASILTDYVRQYVGFPEKAPTPGSGVFMNFDRVLNNQTYQELAWYDLYDELERDPHIAAILQTRKLAVAGLDWDVHPGTDGARDKAIAEFVKKKLRALENFSQDLYELLDAIGKGFAVSEIIWKLDKDGSWTIGKLMNRPQRRFQFDAATRTLKIRKLDNVYYGDPVKDRKFIVHRSSSKYENPFGDALDQKLYWMWIFKRTVTKFWMQYLETSAAPVPFVKYPASQVNKALKSQAMEIAQNIRVSAYGAMPDNFDLMWAEAKNAATVGKSYDDFEEHCNAEMTKCVLGQVLTTEGSGKEGSGSKALGQVHDSVRGDIQAFDIKALNGTVNSTIVKWLVDFNYAGVEDYPRFELKVKESFDRKAEAEVINILSTAGFKPTRDYVETTFDIELEEEQKELVAAPDESTPLAKPEEEENADKEKDGENGEEKES